ncbi:MAG: leucine-rich repeat protein, partial [Clostridia bacterium]|nr:leucine-rich repeat protein [Clostridia bacterium]
GVNFFDFKNDVTSVDYKLQNLEANDTVYQVVVPASCDHSFTGTSVDATCNYAAYADYNCSKCGHNVFFTWGEKVTHNYVLGEHVQATLSSLGSKTYSCSLCGNSKTAPYSLDPSNLEILVKIKNDDGTFEEITVFAGEVFEMTTSGADGDYIYTVSGIKKFGDYNIRNIYGITIPKGILYINILTQNYEKYNNVEYGLVELNIADNAKVDIQNIGNLRKVEKITVGKNAEVVFCASCSWFSPNGEKRDMQKIATIDLSAGNHTVTFMPSAFNGRGALTNLIFGENSTYDIKSHAFYNCTITELKFPATNTYAFSGEQNFYGNDMTELVFPDGVNFDLMYRMFENCKTLTSVKFGENATYSIGSRCFTYCPIPKVVFAPNSTYTIGQQAFANSILAEIDMSAGNMTVTMNNSAFNSWLDNKQTGAITTVKFGENSTYVINEGTFNDALFTELVLAPNSSYTFKRYCINGTPNKSSFKTLDASAHGITLVIEGEAFRYHTAFDTLKINGEGSTYTFNSNSLMDTKIAEITLGKGSTYTFNNCFNGSTPITKIDASADNLNVTVNNYGFGKNTIATILINGKNGTYTFNNEAFRNSIFTELTLGEGSTYTFNSGSCTSVSKIEKIDASANNVTLTIGNHVFKDKTALTELNVSGENSTYTFGQETFRNTKIKEIKAGQNSTYSIGYICFHSCGSMETIDFTANNVTATFGNQAFDGRSTVSYIAFGENSTYIIGEYAFRSTVPTNDVVFSNTSSFQIGREAFRYADFASITFEDNVDVTFTGVDAFKECDKAVTLYIGKNVKITNYPFRVMKALETIYIMEGVTHANEYEFEYAGSGDYSTPLYVYNHSLDFSFNKGLFKECDGIFLYTITDNIGTSTEVFANCGDTNGFKAWTVYLGLAHPLTNYVVDPDCVNNGYNTWIVDGTKCPCGSETYFAETTVINKYEKKHNITSSTAVDEAITFAVTPIAPLGHDKLGAKTNIAYTNYLEKGSVSYICTRCEEEHTIEKDAEALFVFNGYSMPEDGRLVLTVGYIVNTVAVEEYETIAKTTVKYGMVAVLAEKLNGKAPLDETLDDDVRVVKAEISKEYSAFDFKVSGFTTELFDLELVMAMYVTEGDEYVYLQKDQTKLPESISINKVLQQ